MTITTNLSLDLLLFARHFEPAITPHLVGVLLGQQNATARGTPRQIIEGIESLFPRDSVMEALGGFAEGVGPTSDRGPRLQVITGSAWVVVASGCKLFDADSAIMLCRLELGKGGPDRYLVVTADATPPRCWGSTIVQEWAPEPGWTWAGDPSWSTSQAALIATTKDGKYKEPSVHAFLYKQGGQ